MLEYFDFFQYHNLKCTFNEYGYDCLDIMMSIEDYWIDTHKV